MWNLWPSTLQLTVIATVVGIIGWAVIELILWLASFVHITVG